MQISSIFKFARAGWLRLRNADGVLASIDQNGVEQYHHAPYVGEPVTYVAGDPAVAATGTIAFADQPTAGDTITVGEDTFEFVAADPETGEILIGATLGDTIDNVIAALADREDVTAAAGESDDVVVTALVAGVAGNSIILDSEGADITTAGTLADGSDGTPTVFGTPAKAGRLATDGTNLWFAKVDDMSGTNAATWVQLANN